MDTWAVIGSGVAMAGLAAPFLFPWKKRAKWAHWIGFILLAWALSIITYGITGEIGRRREVAFLVDSLNQGKADLSNWNDNFWNDNTALIAQETKFCDWYMRTEKYLKENDQKADAIFTVYTDRSKGCDPDFMRGRIAALESILSSI